MAASQILEEAKRLRIVSDSLDMLAGSNAPVAEGLAILAKSVRHSAMLLEVMVAVKMPPAANVQNRSN